MLDYDLILFTQRQQAEHEQRLRDYARNYDYYRGEHKRMLAVRTGQPDDNVTLNLARVIIDKGVAFLFGKEPAFELTEGTTTPAEKYLAEVWRRNDKRAWLTELGITGGIYGHVFVKLLNDGIEQGLPKLEIVLPEYVQVQHKGNDQSAVTGYRIEWTAEGDDGRPAYYRQEIARNEAGRWLVENRIAQAHQLWQPDPNAPDMVWPWDWCPMLDAPNIILPGSFYGQSDLEDLSEQDAINYVASKINRILRYHAHPKTVGKNFAGKNITVAEDEMLILPGQDSDLFNLEMKSDLASSLAFLDKLQSAFMETARIPRLDPMNLQLGALSGFAMKILYGALLEKTEVKRCTYGALLVEINRRLVDMAGFGANSYATIHWPDPLPEDETAKNATDKFELDYDLASHETVQTRRGLDPKVESQRMEDEQAKEGNVGEQLLKAWQTNQGALQKRRMVPEPQGDVE